MGIYRRQTLDYATTRPRTWHARREACYTLAIGFLLGVMLISPGLFYWLGVPMRGIPLMPVFAIMLPLLGLLIAYALATHPPTTGRRQLRLIALASGMTCGVLGVRLLLGPMF